MGESWLSVSPAFWHPSLHARVVETKLRPGNRAEPLPLALPKFLVERVLVIELNAR